MVSQPDRYIEFLDTIAKEQGYKDLQDCGECSDGDYGGLFEIAFSKLWNKYERNIGIDFEMSKIRAIMDSDNEEL